MSKFVQVDPRDIQVGDRFGWGDIGPGDPDGLEKERVIYIHDDPRVVLTYDDETGDVESYTCPENFTWWREVPQLTVEELCKALEESAQDVREAVPGGGNWFKLDLAATRLRAIIRRIQKEGIES